MNDIYEMWDKIFKTKKVTKDEKQLIQEHMDRVVNELKFFEYIMVDDDMPYACEGECDDMDFEEERRTIKFFLHTVADYHCFNIIDSEEEREC